MKPSWLFSWETNQENPSHKINPDDETISCANFPDNPQSFAIIEGYLFDKHNFRLTQSASDAERIIEYYNIFREGLFSKLRGGFSLVIWDAAERRLIAGRDHMGLIPFYYFEDKGKIAISSSVQSLLNQPGVSKEVNRLVIAEHLLNFYPDQQLWETFFKDVSRLPPAHYLLRKDHHSSIYRYWNPLPSGFEWASKVEENSLVDVFWQAVERCLDAGADSISLSGGLDSVSIAVMAAKIQKKNGVAPPHAVSGKFPGTGADDGHIQQAVAKSLGMTQTLRTPEEILPGTSIIQASLDRSAFSPLPGQNPLESTYSEEMRIASNGRLSKIMLGFGGDEMFFVGYSWLRDLFSRGKFFQIFSFQQMMELYLSGSDLRTAQKNSRKYAARFIVRSILHRTKNILTGSKRQLPSIRLPLWLTKSDTNLRQEINHRHQETLQARLYPGEGYYVASLRELVQEPDNLHFLEHRYFHARKEGYTNLYPYFDPDLIQLAYRIRPERKVEDNLIKAPLQQFLRKNNIFTGLPTQKTDYMSFIHHLLRTEGKEVWHISIGGRELAKISIIDKSSIDDYLIDYFTSRNHDWDLAWKALSTESWLKIFI